MAMHRNSPCLAEQNNKLLPDFFAFLYAVFMVLAGLNPAVRLVMLMLLLNLSITQTIEAGQTLTSVEAFN
ncbi:hypothetical protein GS682_33275 [Nostoc sp. B(2019)]|nr:hypothetical protein [Nostoc sp. B(2019)]